MKPEISLIPEPDRTVEERKPLTKLQRARLMESQKGICGCGCGGKLDDAREGIIDEHVQALGLLGSNDMSNRQLWRKPCSAAKTYERDIPAISKAKRIVAREEGTRRPRKAIPKHVQPWAPKGTRKIPTKKSRRAANDNHRGES